MFFSISTAAKTWSAGSARGWAWLVIFVGTAGPLAAQADGSARPTFTTAGVLQSSPAVDSQGTVYIGANDGKIPPTGYLYAITRAGDLKFPEVKVNEDIDSAPAIGPNGEIYFGSWNGVFYALNPNGTEKFRHPVGGAAPYIASSPAVGQDGIIYFGTGDLLEPKKSAIIALTPGNVELWRQTVDDAIDSSPAIGPDGSIYFGSWDHGVYGLNRTDGSIKWRVATGAPVVSSPAIGVDGTVYIGSTDRLVYALTPDKGEIIWARATGDKITASPVLGADGTVYIGSTDGAFYALNPADGTIKWRRVIGPAINSSAVVRTDGTIIFGTDAVGFKGMLVALNPNDGSDKWPSRYQTDDHVRSSPVIDHDGIIYVGSHDRKLHALNGAGTILSQYSNWPAFRRGTTRTGWALPRTSGGRLINLSTLATVGGGANLIAGFAIQGDTQKSYLVRAVGPTLSLFPAVSNPLGDPTVTVRTQPGALMAFNNDWGDPTNGPPIAETAARLGAFALISGSKDATVVPSLGPGLYTATVESADGSAGSALVEVYDARPDATGATLINLSTLGRAGPGLLTPGLVVGGTEPVRVLIRAVGPGLQQFGVSNVLARPSMTVFSGQTPIRTNTGWSTGGLKGDVAGAAKLAGAFELADGSADNAALVTLAPGDHTIQVSGIGGTAGEVLVEIYIVK